MSSLFSSSNALGSSFQDALALEQQKAMVQAVVFKLTDLAFDECVPKPSRSLSSSEQTCVQAVVGKFLETSEIVVGRLTAQPGSGGQGF